MRLTSRLPSGPPRREVADGAPHATPAPGGGPRADPPFRLGARAPAARVTRGQGDNLRWGRLRLVNDADRADARRRAEPPRGARAARRDGDRPRQAEAARVAA